MEKEVDLRDTLEGEDNITEENGDIWEGESNDVCANISDRDSRDSHCHGETCSPGEKNMNLAWLMTDCIVPTAKELRTLIEEKGADIDITGPNSSGLTPLMIACMYVYGDIAELLLDMKADPNVKCRGVEYEGYTALHFLCRFSMDSYAGLERRKRIAKLLIEHGATIQCDNFGVTPLCYAALNKDKDLVDYIISFDDLVPREEQIIAFEVLGASLAMDPTVMILDDRGWESESYNSLEKAMMLRYEITDDGRTFPKSNHVIQIEDGVDFSECKVMADLEKIKGDLHALRIEAIMILQRVLPPELKQVFLTKKVNHFAILLARDSHWKKSIDFLRLSMFIQSSTEGKLLETLIQILGEALRHWNADSRFSAIPFPDFISMLRPIYADDIMRIGAECMDEPITIYSLMMNLTEILVFGGFLYRDDDQIDLICQLTQDVMTFIQQYGSKRQSITQCLIIAHLPLGLHIDSATLDRLLPVLPCIFKRLFCRLLPHEDVTRVDHEGYTLLQLLIRHYGDDSRDILFESIPIFFRYGCTVHEGNMEGFLNLEDWIWNIGAETTDLADEVIELMRSLQESPLEELAARCIHRHKIPYRGIVPLNVCKFIDMK